MHLAAQLGSDGMEYESLTTRFLKEANKVIELNAKSEKRDIENDDSLCAACGAVEPDVRLTSCECQTWRHSPQSEWAMTCGISSDTGRFVQEQGC